MVSENIIRPASWTNLGAKMSNSLINSANSGKQEWQFVNQLQEIGGTRQREVKKTFASQAEAKKIFDEQAVKFRKMVERITDATIKQSDTELQIHVDGVQIVKMTYRAVPSQCA